MKKKNWFALLLTAALSLSLLTGCGGSSVAKSESKECVFDRLRTGAGRSGARFFSRHRGMSFSLDSGYGIISV